MSWMDAVEGRSLKADVSWSPSDPRWYSDVVSGGPTRAGFNIGPDSAMRVATVFAANSLLAETLASLPCILYRRTGDDSKERAKDHPLYPVLRFRPNAWQSPMDFFGSQQVHVGLRGMAFAEIERSGNPRKPSIAMKPLHPREVTVEQLASGRMRYRHKPPMGQERILTQDEVLSVTDLSDDFVQGRARSVLAREAIAVAAAGEAFVAGFFKNDALGRLLLKATQPLKQEQRAEIRNMVRENYQGWAHRSEPMLLSHGLEADELGKHDDSGFIVEPRKYQARDVAMFWRVHPWLIGLEDRVTWGTNIEQTIRGFITFTFKPWADRWAQSLERCLLSEDERDEFFIEFNFADLLRGDMIAQAQSFQIFRQIGVYSPNEIRRKLNENPRPDGEGDEYQETPTGASPNQGAGEAGPARDEDEDEDEPPPKKKKKPEPKADLSPFIADAARRIASAEHREVEKRRSKATEGTAWLSWLRRFGAEHRQYAAQVMGSLVVASGVEGWVADKVGERVEHSLLAGLDAGIPEGWAYVRPAAVQQIIEETLVAGHAVRRAA